MASRKLEQKAVDKLLKEMVESGLPVQVGGQFEVEAIPSGIVSFDSSTGIGGFPRGRVSMVQGEEGAGKSLLLLFTIATLQRAGGRAAFVDLEHALTPSFAELLGVAYSELIISRPRTLNEAYDVARSLMASGLFPLIGFDSAVALATDDELTRSARSGQKRAGKATVHAEELPKIVSLASMTNTAFVMVNQLRENPSPPSWWKSGKILYSPGGRALRHASSLTVDVSMDKPYKNGNQRVGHRTKTFIRKNKVGVPYLRAEFDLMYATGIDLVAELVTTAIQRGVVKKSSSWFTLNTVDPGTGECLEFRWNGRAAVDEAVKESTELMASLYRLVAEGEHEPIEHTTEAGSWEDVDDE